MKESKGIYTVVSLGDGCDTCVSIISDGPDFRTFDVNWKRDSAKARALDAGAVIHWRGKFWRFRHFDEDANGRVWIVAESESIALRA